MTWVVVRTDQTPPDSPGWIVVDRSIADHLDARQPADRIVVAAARTH